MLFKLKYITIYYVLGIGYNILFAFSVNIEDAYHAVSCFSEICNIATSDL